MRDSILTLNNVALSDFCTYHIGGKARTVKIVYDINDLLEAAQGEFAVIGLGSKLLISDRGYDGTIIVMRVSGIKCTENGVYAYAGAALPALSRFCENNGLGGLDWACGIPGTVGGAVKLNAGAFGSCISDVLVRVDVIADGKIKSIDSDKLELSYRSSNAPYTIVGAEMKCFCQSKSLLSEKRKQFRAVRHEKQPRGFSCGSVFKNADKPAGWYIEQAGLKGLCSGGAVISEKHANFIINKGFATARDVRALIQTAKAEVKDKFDVSLKEEVIYLGEF